MLPRDSEDVDRRQLSGLAPRFHIELRADAPNEFRAVSFRRKHAAEKKQIARLHRFSVCTRSEEHTSELQSRLHLVCRLLLEKKKNSKLTSLSSVAFSATVAFLRSRLH